MPNSATYAYKKPPIVEAVIELRFAPAFTDSELDRFVALCRADYPVVEILHDVNVEVTPGDPPTMKTSARKSGFTVRSKDAAKALIIGRNSFASAVLAPYPGWDRFFEIFLDNMQIFKKVTREHRYIRFGCRFVNRVDIPLVDGKVALKEYLQVGAHFPNVIKGVVSGIEIKTTILLGDNNKANLAIATVDPVMIGFGSVLVDIDVYREENMETSDKFLYESFNAIHTCKNELFEKIVTDKARGLFV